MAFLVSASVVVASFVGSFPAAAAVGPAAGAATDSANSAPGGYRPLTPARLRATSGGPPGRRMAGMGGIIPIDPPADKDKSPSPKRGARLGRLGRRS